MMNRRIRALNEMFLEQAFNKVIKLQGQRFCVLDTYMTETPIGIYVTAMEDGPICRQGDAQWIAIADLKKALSRIKGA